ncbi:sugar kinase [Hydrogenophaga sp. T2]|uniref:sugar kinase n=1 Tax=Hydrogenophaga sp. T2 TaxID=3132823 RepID=UPI003CEC1E6D
MAASEPKPATPGAADIVAYGEAMVEFNQTGEGGGRQYLQGFGGDTSNFAIAAARQGARVAYLSALGDDPYGAMLRRLWDEEGVDHTHVVTDPSAFSAIYFVTHGERGHQFSFFRTGSAASRMTPATLPRAPIEAARVLHLSGISLAISPSACDTGYAAIDCARAAGTWVSFDTNLRLKLWSVQRARAVMSDVIGLCDICLPSYDDVVAITGLTEPDALVDHCLRLGAKTVALKLGEQGAIVANAHERHRIAPAACRPVDATGAGDAFGGAFVARLVAGDGLASAGRYAATVAALSTEGYGAVAPIPRAAQVRALTQAASHPAADRPRSAG